MFFPVSFYYFSGLFSSFSKNSAFTPHCTPHEYIA